MYSSFRADDIAGILKISVLVDRVCLLSDGPAAAVVVGECFSAALLRDWNGNWQPTSLFTGGLSCSVLLDGVATSP